MIKFSFRESRKSQNTTEFAVLLALVASALIAMQVYIKRGIQGRIRDLAREIAPSAGGEAQQYEPATTFSNFTTTQESKIHQIYDNYSIKTYSPEKIIKDGYEETYPEIQE